MFAPVLQEVRFVRRPKTTRREFTKKVALLAAAPLAAAEAAAAPGPPLDGPPRPAEAIASVGQALAEAVRLRYGKYLNEEQLKRVRQRIETSLRSGNAQRRPPLQNADEPDFVFFAEIP
jgi:hypothetical protein